MKEQVKLTISNLERNGFTVRYFQTSEDAKEALLAEIKPEESVGFGGSVTVDQLGIYEALEQQGNTLYWNWKSGPDPEVSKEMRKRAMTTDVYISSTNAITQDGRLVNIDGTGNRLAGLLFGHDRNYVIAGVNKIEKNLDEAMIRVKNIASPKNNQRLAYNNPCTVTGKCSNCDSPTRICRATLVLDRQPSAQKTILYLIGESLGY